VGVRRKEKRIPREAKVVFDDERKNQKDRRVRCLKTGGEKRLTKQEID